MRVCHQPPFGTYSALDPVCIRLVSGSVGRVPSRNHELPLHAELERTQEEIAIYDALLTALGDPHATLDVLLESEDADDARSRLQDGFGFTEIQARAVLDLQFRRTIPLERRRLIERQEELKAQLAHLEGLQSREQG